MFVTFLLPEHATEVGKFFENFILNNLQDLIKKIHIAFSKRPNQIKRILMCLNELSNERDVGIDVVREKLFPLLKGNKLLIDWFMQLFGKPLETPLSEYETINSKKVFNDDDAEELYEEIPSTDLIECDNIDEMKKCGVQYRNGKIYYYSGSLFPAKISFLALDAKIPEQPKSDESKGLCTHAIRNNVSLKLTEEPNENVKKTVGKKKAKKDAKESDENDEKKLKKKKPIICDSNALHAHAVRLNPVHAQNGEKLSDLAHYFTRSPKKTRNKKNTNSPEKTSPTIEAASSSETSPTSSSAPSVSKLKLDDVTDEPVKKRLRTDEPTIPRITTTIVSADFSSSSSSKKPRPEVSSSSSAATSSKKDKPTPDRSSENWTRDEDKIILEEIKIEGAEKEKVIGVLLTKLKRSRLEIQQRYEFLIDLVMMMN